MAKAWYPMINYEKCIECGTCVEFCQHGVYDKQKGPRPVVSYPEGCVQGCKGCSSQCPADAIEYFGDTADAPASDCGCGCGCDDTSGSCGCGGGCSCGG